MKTVLMREEGLHGGGGGGGQFPTSFPGSNTETNNYLHVYWSAFFQCWRPETTLVTQKVHTGHQVSLWWREAVKPAQTEPLASGFWHANQPARVNIH